MNDLFPQGDQFGEIVVEKDFLIRDPVPCGPGREHKVLEGYGHILFDIGGGVFSQEFPGMVGIKILHHLAKFVRGRGIGLVNGL